MKNIYNIQVGDYVKFEYIFECPYMLVPRYVAGGVERIFHTLDGVFYMDVMLDKDESCPFAGRYTFCGNKIVHGSLSVKGE